MKIGAWRRYGRSASNHDEADGVSACHELPADRSAGVGGVLLRRARLALATRYEVGVSVAVDGVGVSGTSECFAPNGDTRRSGFAGTAVCVELLDAEELEGVGEDGREEVGVTADKGSV